MANNVYWEQVFKEEVAGLSLYIFKRLAFFNTFTQCAEGLSYNIKIYVDTSSRSLRVWLLNT